MDYYPLLAIFNAQSDLCKAVAGYPLLQAAVIFEVVAFRLQDSWTLVCCEGSCRRVNGWEKCVSWVGLLTETTSEICFLGQEVQYSSEIRNSNTDSRWLDLWLIYAGDNFSGSNRYPELPDRLPALSEPRSPATAFLWFCTLSNELYFTVSGRGERYFYIPTPQLCSRGPFTAPTGASWTRHG
jgi:hypothetical protein